MISANDERKKDDSDESGGCGTCGYCGGDCDVCTYG